jgi:hypothetical protein
MRQLSRTVHQLMMLFLSRWCRKPLKLMYCRSKILVVRAFSSDERIWGLLVRFAHLKTAADQYCVGARFYFSVNNFYREAPELMVTAKSRKFW